VESKPGFKSLRSARDFESLRKNGRYFNPTPWLMVNYRFQELNEVRCAWTISRAIGPAVSRNRFRRWGREFLRGWSREYKRGLDFNLIFKKQNREFYRRLNHSDLDQALQKVVNRFAQLA
jgi:ribonuclease P protein component